MRRRAKRRQRSSVCRILGSRLKTKSHDRVLFTTTAKGIAFPSNGRSANKGEAVSFTTTTNGISFTANGNLANEDAEEPTIVVSSDDEVSTSSLLSNVINDGTNTQPFTDNFGSSAICSAVHDLQVWAALAQDCIERGAYVDFTHSMKVIASLRRLRQLQSKELRGLQFLDAEVLRYALPLTESFLTLSETCTAPSAIEKFCTDVVEGQHKVNELVGCLSSCLGVAGGLEIVTTAAAVPNSTIFFEYHESDFFIYRLCAYLRTICLGALSLYAQLSRVEQSAKKQRKLPFRKRAALATEPVSLRFRLTEWETSLVTSVKNIITNVCCCSTAYNFPENVLQGLVHTLTEFLGLAYPEARLSQARFRFNPELLDPFHHCVISLILDLYSRYAFLSKSIEASLVHLTSFCALPGSSDPKRNRCVTPIMCCLLSLPGAVFDLPDDPLIMVNTVLSKKILAFEYLAEKTSTVKAVARRLALQLIKHCLLAVDCGPDAHHKESNQSNEARDLRETLRQFVIGFCKASDSPFFPSSNFFLHHIARLCMRLVLLKVRSTSDLKEPQPKVGSNLKHLTVHNREHNVTAQFYPVCIGESALIILDDIAQYVFSLRCPVLLLQPAQRSPGSRASETAQVECGVCGNAADDETCCFLCDNCNRSFHVTCCGTSVGFPHRPSAEWLCEDCQLCALTAALIARSTVPKLEALSSNESAVSLTTEDCQLRHPIVECFATHFGRSARCSSARFDATAVSLENVPLNLQYFLPILNYVDTEAPGGPAPLKNTGCPSQGHCDALFSLLPFDHAFFIRKMLLTVFAASLVNDEPLSDSIIVLPSNGHAGDEVLYPSDEWEKPSDCLSAFTASEKQKRLTALVLTLELLLTPKLRCALSPEQQSKDPAVKSAWAEGFLPRLRKHAVLRVWMRCVAEALSSLRPLIIRVILAVQRMQWHSVGAGFLAVLTSCCAEDPSTLASSDEGPQLLRCIISTFANPVPRFRASSVSIVARLWQRTLHELRSRRLFAQALLDLDDQKRVPTGSSSQPGPPFLTQETVLEMMRRLYACASHGGGEQYQLSPSGNGATPSASLSLNRTAEHLRVLEILVRVCLPLIAHAVEDVAPLVRLRAAKSLKMIVSSLPLTLSFLPTISVPLFLRLKVFDELPSVRSTAAATFCAVWFDKTRETSRAFYGTTDATSSVDLTIFINTLLRLGDESLCNRNLAVDLSFSLENNWVQLRKQGTQNASTFHAAEAKSESDHSEHTADASDANDMIIPLENDASQHCSYKLDVTQPLLLHRSSIKLIDTQLPVLLQVFLYGLATSLYSMSDIDAFFEGVVSRFLQLFLELHETHNAAAANTHEGQDDPKRLTALSLIKALRIFTELRPTQITDAFLRHLFPYIQDVPHTVASTVLVCELCRVISGAILGRAYATLKTKQLASAVFHSSSTLRDFCYLEDAILQYLIPSNRRSLVGVGMQCLCASVCYVTHNFANALEPCLVDCLSFLLSFRYVLLCCKEKQRTLQHDVAGVTLLRRGIELLVRERIEKGCRVSVKVTSGDTDMLKKQLLFVFENIKRRLWLLGVFSYTVHLEKDVVYDLKRNNAASAFTRHEASELLCDATATAAYRSDDRFELDSTVTPEPRRVSCEILSADVADTSAPWDAVISEIQSVLNAAVSTAPQSSLVLSRCLQKLLPSLTSNIVGGSETADSTTSNASDFNHSQLYVITLLNRLAVRFMHEVFSLFLDMYELVDCFKKTCPIDISYAASLRVSILESICLFLQRHWIFLKSRRVRCLFSSALKAWDVPRLQLVALEALSSLLSHYESCLHQEKKHFASAQPLAAHCDDIIAWCLGFVFSFPDSATTCCIPASTPSRIRFLPTIATKDEQKSLQLAALDVLSKLNRQGLINPSVVVDMMFGLFFHHDVSVRRYIWHCFHDTLESISPDIVLVGRITTVLNYGFLTMSVSKVLCVKQENKHSSCLLCRFPDLFGLPGFLKDMSLFALLYKDYISIRQSSSERALSQLTELLRYGPQQFVLAVLSNLDLYDITPQASCCDTARFVAELTSTLQLDVKEGVAFVLRLMFLRWVGDILISFPYEKEKEVLYLSQLLTANVLTEISVFLDVFNTKLNTGKKLFAPALPLKPNDVKMRSFGSSSLLGADDEAPSLRLAECLRGQNEGSGDTEAAACLLAVHVAFSCLISVGVLFGLKNMALDSELPSSTYQADQKRSRSRHQKGRRHSVRKITVTSHCQLVSQIPASIHTALLQLRHCLLRSSNNLPALVKEIQALFDHVINKEWLAVFGEKPHPQSEEKQLRRKGAQPKRKRLQVPHRRQHDQESSESDAVRSSSSDRMTTEGYDTDS